MRTKRAFMNMASSMTYLVINVICGLITPRLILMAYGSTYNGIISSATQFLGMINVLTLGVAGPTRVALYNTIAKNDHLGTSRVVRATKIFMKKVALMVVIYAVILMFVYPMVARVEVSYDEVALLIAIISISTFAQYFFAFTNRTLLSADQAEYVTNIFDIVKVVINTIITAILIYAGASLFIVKLGSSIIYFICPMIMETYVKKKYKLINDCEPDNRAIKERQAATFHSVANIIHDNTDIVLLTLFTNVLTVSVYTVYNLIATALRNCMKVFTNSLEAPFGNMWAKKEYEVLKKNFEIYELAIFLFAAIVFSSAGILMLPFVRRYTAGVTDTNYILPAFAFLITASECIYCIRQPYLTLVQATGNYEATKKDAMYEAIINILVSAILVNLIGINGVMVGTIVANLYRTIKYAIFTSKEILKQSMKKFVLRSVWLGITIFISVSTSIFIEKGILFNANWIGWIEQAICTVLIECTICSAIAFVVWKSTFKSFIRVLQCMVLKK